MAERPNMNEFPVGGDDNDGTNAKCAPAAANPSLLLSNADLKKMDSAIQMRLKVNRTMPRRLTFDEFYSLLEKTELACGSGGSTLSTATPLPVMDAEALDRCGTILYEFLVAFSPLLYKIYETRNVLRAGNQLSWYIDSAFAGTSKARCDALDKCLRSRLNSNVNDVSIRQAIMNHRKKKETRRSLVEQAQRQTQNRIAATGDEALIQPGMSLDERVRARACAKRARTEESKLNDEENPDQTTHRGFLLQLAYGLWQHSNFILAKRQRIMSPARKAAAPSPLVLTLKDAVESLKAILTAGTGKTLMKRGEPITKRQLVTALEELSQIAPVFITITSDSSGVLNKNATVWMDPNQFGSARAKLTGSEDSEHAKSAPPVVSLLSRQRIPMVPKRRDGQTLVANNNERQVPFRLISSGSTDNGPEIAAPSSPRMHVGTKREGSDNQDSFPASSHKKQKRGLRINYNLIHSPADHVGGEIIDIGPMHQSPRGLKLLFEQMKAGQRI